MYDADIRYRQYVSASNDFYSACIQYIKYYDADLNLPEPDTEEYNDTLAELERIFAQ
jgi:hypothetical protein